MRTIVTASNRLALCLFGTVAVASLAHCGGGSDAGPGSSGGSVTDGGGPLPDATSSSGAACTPKTCEATANCGTYDDGCGNNLSCAGACTCTPNDFEQVCPPRPCETVAGCTDGTCVYAPVTCGTGNDQQTCAPVPCTGEECGNVATAAGEDDKIYACGGHVCAAVTAYCDPKATVSGGVISYQNVCIAPPKTGCGTCGLGTTSCNAQTDRFLCDGVPVPVLENGGTVECDSTTAASSFVYMDALYTQNNSNGSKARPWKTYAEALQDAQARNARGIVIGGSPVFTAPLEVTSGIGVYGGFGLSPDFTPEPTQRPKWDVPATAIANDVLVGVKAKNVTAGTALFHLQIVTADLVTDAGASLGTPGASNVGVWVEDSNGLRLVDMLITTGRAGDGRPGAAGTTGDPGKPGNVLTPGGPGASCVASVPECTTRSSGPQGTACGAGGVSVPQYAFDGNGHSAETPDDGGRGGASVRVPVGCPGFAPGPGLSGVNGTPGPEGGNGAGGPRPALGLAGIEATTGGDGSVGGVGSVGSGGGGGGGLDAPNCQGSYPGGYGGGTGGNGCGGLGAAGGGAGGVALGVALVGTSRTLLVTGGSITSGHAGVGGSGGAGGTGGNGGTGSPGGFAPSPYTREGGKGGNGGQGGRGGHGGGGGGGDSFAIACASAEATVSFGESPQLASGAAGVPGASPGNAGTMGMAGTTLTCMVTVAPD